MSPLSGVISEAWQLYRAHARHLISIAFVVYLVAAVVAALLTAGLGTFGLVLGYFFLLVAAFLLQASLVKAVQDVRDGQADLSLGQTFQSVVPSLGTVAGVSILAGIAIYIGLFLLIVPGLYLITIWAVIMPVVIIEQSGVGGAFSRSQQLVRGNGWNVFGTLVLVFLMLIVAEIVIGLILSVLPHFLSSALAVVVAGSLIAPFIAVVVTLMYYRLSGASVPAAASGYSEGTGFGSS
jgi:hypothetical protein